MSDPIAYLNGTYLPLSEARISVLDRGFLFGDGVYEVIPAYGGTPFRLGQHLQRLENSLQAIRMEPPLDRNQWRIILQRLLHGNGDQAVYLQITRGTAPKRDHAFPASPQATVVAWATPIANTPPQPARAITHPDIRWQWCHIKAITLLANVLMRQQAVDEGCQEAILVRDDMVTEGAASNVFALIEGTLVTPAKGPHLLPGITRDLILELATANDIPYEERNLSAAELASASEIWLSSSTRELVPVVELDHQPVSDGEPGPLWQRMYDIFQHYKRSLATAR